MKVRKRKNCKKMKFETSGGVLTLRMGKHTYSKLQTRVGRKTTNIRRFPGLKILCVSRKKKKIASSQNISFLFFGE
jgi:hypothetical protein